MALKSPNSRQAAYMARNRAAIITAAQEVLADIGPQATVEQLADHAQISTTTFYKYFDSKEIFLLKWFPFSYFNYSNSCSPSFERQLGAYIRKI